MVQAPSITDSAGPCSLFEPNRNIAALLRLASTIEAVPAAQFDMSSAAIPGRPVPHPFKHTCTTAGCIAGWAATLWPEAQSATPGGHTRWKAVKIADLLGISISTAKILFYPEDVLFEDDDEETPVVTYDEISQSRAAQELRRLAFEGIVSWAEAPSPYWLLRQCDGLSGNGTVIPMWLLSKSTSTADEPNIYWLVNGDPVGPFATEADAIKDFNSNYI